MGVVELLFDGGLGACMTANLVHFASLLSCFDFPSCDCAGTWIVPVSPRVLDTPSSLSSSSFIAVSVALGCGECGLDPPDVAD